MLEMIMASFLVFGGFGLMAMVYAITNIIIGATLALVHIYHGGHYPMEVFKEWMRHI